MHPDAPSDLLMKSSTAAALLLALWSCVAVHASPAIVYNDLLTPPSPNDMSECNPDRVYLALRAKYFFSPVDLVVRGLAARAPVWRLDTGALVGRYGPTRDGGATFHAGTDLLAERGEPVRAIAEGVAEAFPSTGEFGNYVLQTLLVDVPLRRDPCVVNVIYAHLNDFKMVTGKSVRLQLGQTIGTVGRTGYDLEQAGSIPTHLHIELWLRPYVRGVVYRPIYTRDILPLLATCMESLSDPGNLCNR